MVPMVSIPIADIKAWPTEVRDHFMKHYFADEGPPRDEQEALTPVPSAAAIKDVHFIELTATQARSFIAGCGDKVKKAVMVIVSGESRYFQLAAVAKELDTDPGKLGGVWGGITRRLKTVTGDSGAYLIDWEKSKPVFDTEGNYVDHRAELTEASYHSLRGAFGLN